MTNQNASLLALLVGQAEAAGADISPIRWRSGRCGRSRNAWLGAGVRAPGGCRGFGFTFLLEIVTTQLLLHGNP